MRFKKWTCMFDAFPGPYLTLLMLRLLSFKAQTCEDF